MSTSRIRIDVLVSNDLATDQRVAKVCQFLHENHFQVRLWGRFLPDSLPLDRAYEVRRVKLPFRSGPLFYASLNICFALALLFRRTNWILANDLDTLLAAFLIKRLKGGRLIYDSHEYFCGVPELMARPTVRRIWHFLERKMLPKTDTMYTVNSSIAALYFEEYGVEARVLRNVSPLLKTQDLPTKNWPEKITSAYTLIIQGAGINVDRGGEEAILALHLLPEVQLVFLGSGDAISQLQLLTAQERLQDRVIFMNKLPYVEMMSYTVKCFAGLSLDKPQSPNYIHSLPNKLFDYIQARVPVIASSVKEVKQIVEEHQVGEVVNEVTPEAIAAVVQNWINHPEIHAQYKTNCSLAAATLCWEKEVKVLREIYGKP